MPSASGGRLRRRPDARLWQIAGRLVKRLWRVPHLGHDERVRSSVNALRISGGRAARRILLGAVACLAALSLAACGLQIPSDPDGTLDRVSGGELRVGAVEEPGLVETDGPSPDGPLPELVRGFADTLDARVTWRVGSEETLVAALEQGELDLVIGGFTDQTPWIEQAGLTRGYRDIEHAEGRNLVLLVPMGENAFLSALERYLDEEVGG